MNKQRKTTLTVTTAGLIAALYVAFTFLSSMVGLSSGVIQVRISEALCVLPCFTPAAVPGLFIGCILANWLTGCVVWDIVFGSIATLIGALGARSLRKKAALAPWPTILANAVIVPFVLAYAYGVEDGIPFLMLTVGAGEVVSCGLLGMGLYYLISKRFGKMISKLN